MSRPRANGEARRFRLQLLALALILLPPIGLYIGVMSGAAWLTAVCIALVAVGMTFAVVAS